ncbi:MAG: DUF4153 domain-containing protein [Bacteroidaceae bacterium]|nr:DUF4153 domain-containing protein [Bacteroidaceae bacterium]
MNTKIKTLLQQLLLSPKKFPVEAALGLAFFLISAWHLHTAEWSNVTGRMESDLNADILWLFVPLIVLSFWLRKVNRWLYFASFFLFVPLMALNLKPFLWTYGVHFTYVLAAILLVLGVRKMSNQAFASHALHVVTQLFFGFVITGILNLAVLSIVASFLYIFGINQPNHIYEHIIQFIWFVLAPQICFTLITNNEDEMGEPAKVLRLILNFILSPAVIIYTVILYVYFFKIAIEWDLPKGGVAWIVMGFITAALVGRVAQSVLSQRYYDWYYRRFTLIAIPPLILYWIGSIYRIRLYSFTESRFYLMVAGVLMTLFVLMLLHERTRRFQLMAIIFGVAIILFSYIPGISAKSIGLKCQKERLKEIISELKLANPKTGKLNDDLNVSAIQKDSLLSLRYQDACSIIRYVRKEVGSDKFDDQYGNWSHSEYEFRYTSDALTEDKNYSRKKPIQLGDYNIMLQEENYRLNYDKHVITVGTKKGKTILAYPIDSLVRKNPILLKNPKELLTYKNDSLMLVLDMISFNDSTITYVSGYDFFLFKKKTEKE